MPLHKSSMKKIYGWYSKSADIISDLIVTYNTIDNRTVKVTCVTDNPDSSGTAWHDIRCVGELSRYVSSVKNTKTYIINHNAIN